MQKQEKKVLVVLIPLCLFQYGFGRLHFWQVAYTFSSQQMLPEPIELETQVEVSSEEGTSGGDFADWSRFRKLALTPLFINKD